MDRPPAKNGRGDLRGRPPADAVAKGSEVTGAESRSERKRERSADVWLVGRARGDGSECAKLKKGGRDCQESGGPA